MGKHWKEGEGGTRLLRQLHASCAEDPQSRGLVLLQEGGPSRAREWALSYRSPPGSSVRGILQARRQQSVALPFSRGSSQPRDPTRVSCTAGGFSTV